MAKLICFDLDGVLVDSMDWHFDALNAAIYEACGFYMSKKDHDLTYKGLPTKRKIEMLIEAKLLPPEKAGDIESLKAKHFAEIIKIKLKPDPKNIRLMAECKSDFLNVAVVSNCNKFNSTLLLGGLDLLDRIDYLVTSSDVVVGKPSPEGYYKAMLHFGAQPSETLIIEDSPVGLKAAYASGAMIMPVEGPDDVTWQRISEYL